MPPPPAYTLLLMGFASWTVIYSPESNRYPDRGLLTFARELNPDTLVTEELLVFIECDLEFIQSKGGGFLRMLGVADRVLMFCSGCCRQVPSLRLKQPAQSLK